MRRPLRAALALVTAALLACCALTAQAARIGVLSNKNAEQVAADFQAKIPSHDFSGVDVGAGPPSLSARARLGTVVGGCYFSRTRERRWSV